MFAPEVPVPVRSAPEVPVPATGALPSEAPVPVASALPCVVLVQVGDAPHSEIPVQVDAAPLVIGHLQVPRLQLIGRLWPHLCYIIDSLWVP